MPKATLEFTLPEEKDEFETAVSASKAYSCLWELKNWMRNELKYNSDKYTEEGIKIVEKVEEKFFEIINESGVSLDNL